MAFTYWQPMQVLFGTVDLDAHTWRMIVAVASTVFLLVEIEKFFRHPSFLPKSSEQFKFKAQAALRIP
jgi:hypothetical protein